MITRLRESTARIFHLRAYVFESIVCVAGVIFFLLAVWACNRT